MSRTLSSIIRKKHEMLISGSIAVGVVLLITACQYFYFPYQQLPQGLSITLRASQSGSVVLYYDTGMRFREQESQSMIITGDSAWHTYTFPLTGQNIKALRFNPPAFKNAEFQIRDISVINNEGKILRRIDPEDIKPLQQARNFECSDRIIRFQTDEKSSDPQLLISPEHPISFASFAWDHVLRGTFLLWLVVAGLGTFIVLLLTIHTFRTEKPIYFKKIAILFVLTVPYLLCVFYLHSKISSCFLKVSIKATSAEKAQFYFDTGHGYSERQTAASWVNSVDSFGQYRFPLPHKKIYHLRFDPPSTDGTVIIKKILVTDGLGRVIKDISLQQLYPLHQVEKFNLQDEYLTITATIGAADPQIGINLPNPLRIKKGRFWADPLFITIILAFWAMILLLFKSFNILIDNWIIIETAFRSPSAVLLSERLLIGVVLCLFVIYAKGQWFHTVWFLRHILGS